MVMEPKYYAEKVIAPQSLYDKMTGCLGVRYQIICFLFWKKQRDPKFMASSLNVWLFRPPVNHAKQRWTASRLMVNI